MAKKYFHSNWLSLCLPYHSQNILFWALVKPGIYRLFLCLQPFLSCCWRCIWRILQASLFSAAVSVFRTWVRSMAKPGLLVHHPADGFSLVPEALPALSQPVVFPPGHFNSCYKVSASPEIQRHAFSSWEANESTKLLSHPLTIRPKMQVWVEKTKMSLRARMSIFS